MFTKILSFIFQPSQEIIYFCENMMLSPEDWTQGVYCFKNKENPDLEIWTCSGVSYIKIGGMDCLSLGDKLLIAKSIKKTLAKKIIKINK